MKQAMALFIGAALSALVVGCSDRQPTDPQGDDRTSLEAFPVYAATAEAEPLLYDGLDEPTAGSHVVVRDGSLSAGIECRLTTFEGGGQAAEIHPDLDFLIPGLNTRFPGWLTLTSGNYANNPSPPTVAIWTGGVASRDITFDEPVSKVGFFYASFPDVTLEAFDPGGRLVASAVGPANFTTTFDVWDPLGVELERNRIVQVTVTGNSNQTGIDDFEVCRKHPPLKREPKY